VGFLKEVAKCINKSIYYILDIEENEFTTANSKPEEKIEGILNHRDKINYLEAIIEVQKNDLESKKVAINALQEALDQVKARLEEQGLEFKRKKN